METAQIVALRVTPHATDWVPVRVEGDAIVVDRLRVVDRALAAFVEQRAPDDRADLIERALRIGLHAVQDAGTAIDVDVVRREFDSLLERNVSANERAARELDQILRQNFSDRDGRLPQTLERFLGDRGQLNRFVTDLFDETKRDSAIGRMRTLLGTYFDGDASRLGQMLDPTRLGSPLHQFRNEMTDGFEKLNARLTAIEAAQAARGAERMKSAAKGTDYEDLLEAMLADCARGMGDLVERTGTISGDMMRSKKGDFLLTVDPTWCHGADLRVVIEAKNRKQSWREIRDELDVAKRNRDAAIALAIFAPEHAPAGIEPFDARYGHIFCVVDPDSPDQAVLTGAVKLARLYAMATLAERSAAFDAQGVLAIVAAIKTELEALRRLKTQLTAIRTTAGDISAGLDRLRDAVLARVAEAEEQLATSS